MSPKRLAGWEPASETTYEYDTRGRVSRAVTRREVEWDDAERGWAVALLEYEADICQGCGGRLSETTDPASEGHWHVPLPTRCHRCTSLAAAQEPYRETKHGGALLWSAERRR